MTLPMCGFLVVVPMMLTCSAGVAVKGFIEKSQCDNVKHDSLLLCYDLYKDRNGRDPR
jgi:hypothetical protein